VSAFRLTRTRWYSRSMSVSTHAGGPRWRGSSTTRHLSRGARRTAQAWAATSLSQSGTSSSTSMTTPPDRKRGSTSARQNVASRSLISVSADQANSGLANRVIGLPGIYNGSMNIRSRRMRPAYLRTNIGANSDEDWAEYKRTVSFDHGERICFVDIGEGPGPVLLLI